MYGHDYHFHIRIKCPPGSGECESQPPPAESEGCSAGDLATGSRISVLHPNRRNPAEAETADDAGAITRGVPAGSGGAGCEAIRAFVIPGRASREPGIQTRCAVQDSGSACFACIPE